MTGEVPGLKVGGWRLGRCEATVKGVFLGLVGSLCGTGGGGGGGGVVYD